MIHVNAPAPRWPKAVSPARHAVDRAAHPAGDDVGLRLGDALEAVEQRVDEAVAHLGR